MYNFLPVFLGFLHKLDLISEDAYKRFSDELKDKIFSADTELTKQMLDEAFKKVEEDMSKFGVDKTKIEPWLDHISILDNKIKGLEAKIKELSKPQKVVVSKKVDTNTK